MYPLPPVDRRAEIDLAIRIAAGVFASVFAVPFVFAVWWAIDEHLDTSNDHLDGFGSLPALILAIPSGVATSLVLPFLFPRRLWLTAYVVSVPTFTVLLAVLVFVTADG